MLRALGPLHRLAVLHTNAEQEARLLLEDYQAQLPTEPLVVNITTVIGAHVGPHGLGFAAIIKDAGW
jgi:fatty acid-binding protein DegV